MNTKPAEVPVTPRQFGFSTEIFSPNVEEFALAVSQCSPVDVDGVELPGRGARILICTGGYVEVSNEVGERLRLERGESMFASADDGRLRARGVGEVAQAYTPSPDAPDIRMLDLI